jgi:N-acetylneuraminic acid mutarotase
MNFQARLLQSSGALVSDGNYNVQFKLYDSSTEGSALWAETYQQTNRVRVANGYLTVNLGALQSFPSINWDQELWLTMNVGGTANTSDPEWDGEMTPRLKLTAVPHAFTASKLQQTNGGNSSTLGFATQTGSRSILLPDESGTVCLQSSANCGFVTGSTSSFIQNSTSPQTADFNVTGSGTVGTNLAVGGNITLGSSSALVFNSDTNLYRGGANILKTDDTFDAAAFSVGGVAGISASCSSGQVLQDQVVVGGIVTGGTCVSGGASSLQDAYEGGNTILTSDARDISFTLADTSTDSNFIINVEDGSTSKFAIQNDGNDTFSVDAKGNVLSKTTENSTNAFQIQNADGESLLNIDTANNVITLGGNNSGELQQWQSTTSLPNPRWFSTSAVANGYIYTIGGAQESGSPQDTVYYAKLNSDGTVGSWNTASNALPETIQAHSTAVANGYLYVLGGHNGSGASSNVYFSKLSSDGSVGPWVETEGVGSGSYWHKSVAANGYVYAMGGYNGSTTYDEVMFTKANSDGSLSDWGQAGELPTNLHSFGTAVANGYLYIIGGYTGSTYSDDVYYAKINDDGSLGSWTTETDTLPLSLTSLQTVVMNGYIYAIGGNDNSNTVRSEVYYAKLDKNGGTGPWQTAANGLPNIRNQAAAATNNGYVYLIGGRQTSSTTPVDTVYYTSGQRLMVGGSLDLVGLSDSNLADGGDGGSLGGSLTAGNTNIIGTFQVRGDASFSQSVNVGGNLHLNGNFTLQNATDSMHAFQIQQSDGSNVLRADTDSGRILIGSAANPTLSGAQLAVMLAEVQTSLRVGNATNGFSFNDAATGESGKLRLYGSARNVKRLTFTPEYAGAVLSQTPGACHGSDTGSGSMTAGFDSSANKNYYKWTTTQSNCQSYEIVTQITLPSDWDGWATSLGDYSTNDGWVSSTSNAGLYVTILDITGDVDVNNADITPGSPNTWITDGGTFSGTYAADGIMTVKFRLTARSNASVQLGNFYLNYLSKF